MTLLDIPEVKFQIRPLIDELFVVTKDRGLQRLGDVINYAQIAVVEEVERQINERNGMVRVIILKSRQIGISTIIEAIMFVGTKLLPNFKGMVVSHEKDSAEHILSITNTYWKNYVFRDFHTERYNGRNHLAWEDNDTALQVATARNVDVGRSRTLQAAHASEFAFWPDPENILNSLLNSIPNFGITFAFIESTANGIGNPFHSRWNAAVKGESIFKPLFFPWWKHPENVAAFLPAEVVSTYFIDKYDEEELELKARYNLSDARLIWRRYTIANDCGGDVNKFHQEHPSNPHEAFVATGRNVFPLKNLLAHYEPRRGRVGRLLRVRNRVEFIEDANGPLRIFVSPSDDKDWGVYQIGADPTHTVAGDYAVAQVINRRTNEQVAIYRSKIDMIKFASDLYLLGTFYNNARIAPEKEGPGYATVGALLGMNYPNVYESAKIDNTPGKVSGDTFGWGTNVKTKHVAVNALVHEFSQSMQHIGNVTYGITVHDEITLTELRDYVTTEDGSGYENADGSDHDDTVMALAIAVATSNIDEPPSPYVTYDPDDEASHDRAFARHHPVTSAIQDAGIDLKALQSRVHKQMTDPSDGPDNDQDQPPAPWESWDE